MRKNALTITLTAAAIAGAACSESGSTAPGQPVVLLSLASQLPGAAASGSFALGANQADELTVALGTDVIVITQAELVLREIELERVETVDCDSGGSSGSDDGCEEIVSGPRLFPVPLAPGAAAAIEVTVQPGSYDELEFDIHKPEDDGLDPADVAFLSQHPDFARISMRIQGTWNGDPFTYETDLNVEQELDLVPPLTFDAPGTHEVVLLVNLSAFFVDAAGTGLVDPDTANKGQPSESLVTENIKRAFEAFENDD